jgi:hypothetical protein
VDKVYCVYILTNQRNTVLYTGVTGDLGARVYQHREKLLPGFTNRYNVGKTDQGRLTAEEDRPDQRVQSCSGESGKGLAQIGQGVDSYGLGVSQHILLALQADAQLAIGKPEAALASVAAGLKAVEKMGGALLEAELYRLRGEALLAGAGTVSGAETAMQQGIDVARRQNAKSWELHAAMSLARLRRQQGRPQEAVALLAPILGWFEEGFDIADLQAARTLLDEIASSLRSSQ